MVGASSRLIFLFTGPISLLRHRPFSLNRLARRHCCSSPLPTLSVAPHHLIPLSRPNSLIPIKFSQSFHSRTTSDALQESNYVHADDCVVQPSHPWPEWSRLLESLSVGGYLNGKRNIEDEFVANENQSMEFVAAASACLAFARDRPDILGCLRRKDIEVLINGGSPFLFKSAIATERIMRSFLQAEGSDEARTVDLMKYILSYASNPIIYPERNIKEATESSVRNLLQEMANWSSRGQASEQFQGVGRDEQMPRNLGPNITMKRGDWICPKCSFMNFARNTKCLECEELRPQRQLTDGEWDCPQCNFFNYRRNVVCLKCECRRPGYAPIPGPPGPAKTPSDRQLIGSHYRNDFQDNGTNFRSTNKNLATSNDSSVSGRYNENIPREQNDRKDGSTNYVPFVPLPADMFAEKREKMTNEHSDEAAIRRELEHSQSSERSVRNVQNGQIIATNEEGKPERWFKKVTELHGVTDTINAISNEEFPQIMPLRKGENRFVVSKKNDRSFSPYNRQPAMEQATDSSFVPFVPFPPDYFAKKDDRQPKNADSTGKPTDEASSSHSHQNSNAATHDKNLVQRTGNQHAIGKSTNGGSSSNQFRITETRPEPSSIGAPDEPDVTLSKSTNGGSSSNQFRITESRPEPFGAPDEPDVRSGWTGKSLEGSAVTEPDQLDMSEEAKAERWFRRVAQIKDISELSQIPDEDFPSIMPMRKGVNRFVVSKRKTPLERRLTSPQYRKNLRIMSSEPLKKEGDDDN